LGWLKKIPQFIQYKMNGLRLNLDTELESITKTSQSPGSELVTSPRDAPEPSPLDRGLKRLGFLIRSKSSSKRTIESRTNSFRWNSSLKTSSINSPNQEGSSPKTSSILSDDISSSTKKFKGLQVFEEKDIMENDKQDESDNSSSDGKTGILREQESLDGRNFFKIW